MATSNFAPLKNASTIFVVGEMIEENYSECECGRFYEWEENYKECPFCKTDDVTHSTEYRHPESWEWDDIQSNLGASLTEIEGYYSANALGTIEQSKVYGDCEIIVRFIPTLKSGYYEAAQLDYEIEIETNRDCFNYLDTELDDILEEAFAEYQSDLNRGLATIHTKNARKWLESTINNVSEQIEKVFTDHSSSKLQRVGGFSNGSSVYEEVK